jgi:hypothetical protein
MTDVLNEDISLNSLVFFNWDDRCTTTGYIINIKIRFCKPFRLENTLDGFLCFFVTDAGGSVHSKYSVIPSNTLLIQSFSISQRDFLIRRNCYLSVGTFSNNSKGTNTVCLREIGYLYSGEIISNINIHKIDQSWTGSQIGICIQLCLL